MKIDLVISVCHTPESDFRIPACFCLNLMNSSLKCTTIVRTVFGSISVSAGFLATYSRPLKRAKSGVFRCAIFITLV